MRRIAPPPRRGWRDRTSPRTCASAPDRVADPASGRTAARPAHAAAPARPRRPTQPGRVGRLRRPASRSSPPLLGAPPPVRVALTRSSRAFASAPPPNSTARCARSRVRSSLAPRASRSSASSSRGLSIVGLVAEQRFQLRLGVGRRPIAASSAAASRAGSADPGPRRSRGRIARARLGCPGGASRRAEAQQRARVVRLDLERAREGRARRRRGCSRQRERATAHGVKPAPRRGARADPRRRAPRLARLPGRGELFGDRRQRLDVGGIREIDLRASHRLERRVRSAALADPLAHGRHGGAAVGGLARAARARSRGLFGAALPREQARLEQLGRDFVGASARRELQRIHASCSRPAATCRRARRR